MKKYLILLLTLSMLLGLCACAGGEETGEEKAWDGGFSVGFGRADVTPKISLPMGGYASAAKEDRSSQGVLNALCITCVAVTDDQGQTVLLYTYDSRNIHTKSAQQITRAVSEATGIPEENIMIGCTHTHSSPYSDGSYLEQVTEGAVQAAQDALADRAAATVEYTTANLEQMSFVRHYNTDTGVVVGDNFSPEGAGSIVSHTTEADNELRLLRFAREGKKPIVMANWLGHASMASTSSSEFGKAHHYFLSSDYVGFCRDYVEKNLDCHFGLYMGASGNINPTSRIPGEDTTKSAIEYGEKLGQHILTALDTMAAGQDGQVKLTTEQFQAATQTVDINAIGFGSIGVITAPLEMFDTTAMYVRENSPYDITFVMTLTNGSVGYMPTEICYDYVECYERSETIFGRGDAEKMADTYVQMLNRLHG